MNDPTPQVEIALRIPGVWTQPQELVQSLPADHHLTPDSLTLPDGAKVDFGVAKADDQFAQIFRSSCRNPPSDDELATVDNYAVNVFLSGPGGSLQAAHTMMQAAAAIVRAGGAGVFIDNSAVAHGGRHWLEMTDDGSPEALSFAFVAIVGGDAEVYTMGMHALGLRDIVMKRKDAEADEFGVIEVIRYMAQNENCIEDGHLLADLTGPRFQAFAHESMDFPPDSPMHNPIGKLKLVSMGDIAERN